MVTDRIGRPFISGGNNIRNASIGTTNQVATMPAPNLAGPLWAPYRSTGLTTEIYVVWPADRPIGVIAAWGHNLTQLATWSCEAYGPALFSLATHTETDVKDQVEDESITGILSPSNGALACSNVSGTLKIDTAMIPGYDPAKTYGATIKSDAGIDSFAPAPENDGENFLRANGLEIILNNFYGTIGPWVIREQVVAVSNQPAIGPQEIWGGLPWGEFRWDHLAPERTLHQFPRMTSLILPEVKRIEAVWMRFNQVPTDDWAPEYIQIASLFAAYGILPSTGAQSGIGHGLTNPSSFGEGPGGIRTNDKHRRPRRQAPVPLNGLTTAEIATIERRIMGNTDEVFYARWHKHPETGLLQWGQFLGYLDKPSIPKQTRLDRWNHNLTITETGLYVPYDTE